MAVSHSKSRSPMISVIIPSYNHGEFIAEAIASVVAQNYRPLELIIVDDGSQDNSVTVINREIKDLQKHGPGLAVRFFRQPNSGAHIAINRGLNLADGEWLTILNSDDRFLPKRLSKLISKCRGEKSLLGLTRVLHVDANDRLVPPNSPFVSWYRDSLSKTFPTVGFHLLYNNVAVSTGNLFFHKSLFERLGGFRSYELMHDYDFILRSLTWTEPVWLREPLLAYRIHGQNTVTRVRHKSVYEAAEVATDFLAQTVLFPDPPNRAAPWAPRWGDKMKKFLTDNKDSWLRGWIGPDFIQESLAHLDKTKNREMW